MGTAGRPQRYSEHAIVCRILFYSLCVSPVWKEIDQNETRGTKCESLFHALYFHNQMDNVCTGKD